MLRFVADEDFTRAIVRGVLRARPDIDLVRVQDVGLRTQEDAVVLNWAATEGRWWRNAVERVNGKDKSITSRCGNPSRYSGIGKDCSLESCCTNPPL